VATELAAFMERGVSVKEESLKAKDIDARTVTEAIEGPAKLRTEVGQLVPRGKARYLYKSGHSCYLQHGL